MPASCVDDPQRRIADSDAIYNLIEQLQVSWNAHDGVRFAGFFYEHADCTAWNGAYLHGRAAIGLSYRHLFGAPATNLILEIQIVNIRFLTDDVCLAHAVARTYPTHPDLCAPNVIRTNPDERTKSPKFCTQALLILTKQNQRWRCEVLHNNSAKAR